MATTTKADPKTRTIYVRSQSGDKIVEGIPATAKITFGALQPGQPKYGGAFNTSVLRIYTTANNQLAVFVDVIEFRDLSLSVKERKVKRTGKTTDVVGPNQETHEVLTDRQFEWEAVDAF